MTPNFAFADPDQFHKQLARFNATRVAPGVPTAQWHQSLHAELAHGLAEGEYLETLRAQVSPMIPRHEGDSGQLCKLV